MCERFDELVEGREESNEPAVAECFRECPLMPPEKDDVEGDVVLGWASGEGASAAGAFRGMSLEDRGPAADLAAAAWAVDALGREKFCRLLVLPFACDVKLV